MAQLTVRKLPPEVVRALKIRAAQHGRSAEAEHRLVLEEAFKPRLEDFWTHADALRRKCGKQRRDSTELLRKMRAER